MSWLSKNLSKVTKSVAKLVTDVTSPIAQGIGQTLNDVTGVTGQMDKSYEQQKEAMNAQNQYNKEMWDLQNQYNTPAAQLARMAEAGIDINPISYALGTGNLSNTAGSLSSEGGFAGNGSPAGNPISMALGVAQASQGIKEAQARTLLDSEHTAMMRSQRDRLDHDIQWAKDHNLPVGVVPDWSRDAWNTLTGAVRKNKKALKDSYNRLTDGKSEIGNYDDFFIF